MAKITTKGQVTIPKRLRDHLGLKPGSSHKVVIGLVPVIHALFGNDAAGYGVDGRNTSGHDDER